MRIYRTLTSIVGSTLLFASFSGAALALDITSDPAATGSSTYPSVHLKIGGTVIFTRHGQMDGAFQWNWNKSVLNCQGYPDFDSPQFKCSAIANGESVVSLTVYTPKADGSEGYSAVNTTNEIVVFVDAESSQTSSDWLPEGYCCVPNDPTYPQCQEKVSRSSCESRGGTLSEWKNTGMCASCQVSTPAGEPLLQIKDVNFYQKYEGDSNVIVFDVCNIGKGKYVETKYGTVSFQVSFGGKSDGLAFSGDLNPGECTQYARPNLLSSFYNFANLETGYYDMDLKLQNKPASNPSFSKRVYVISASTPLPASYQGSNVTSPPAAGYEDEVLVNQTQFTNPFPDTALNNLEGKAAAELHRRAVIGGFPDGQFKGDRPVNRAEAAKFLLLARFGSVADVANSGRFPDVLDGQWYTKFVLTASQKGIIKGYPDGLFRPADQVNTAEFLKMLSLTFDLKLNMDYHYNDVPSDSWFAQYAGIAQKYNLFPGRSSNLSPETPLSRADVAIAIYQYLSQR